MTGHMSQTDQIAAHVRDLTPGQLVEFIVSMSAHTERMARILAAEGRMDAAGPIGLASSLATLAATRLRETIPGECVADTLKQINQLVYGGGPR